MDEQIEATEEDGTQRREDQHADDALQTNARDF